MREIPSEVRDAIEVNDGTHCPIRRRTVGGKSPRCLLHHDETLLLITADIRETPAEESMIRIDRNCPYPIISPGIIRKRHAILCEGSDSVAFDAPDLIELTADVEYLAINDNALHIVLCIGSKPGDDGAVRIDSRNPPPILSADLIEFPAKVDAAPVHGDDIHIIIGIGVPGEEISARIEGRSVIPRRAPDVREVAANVDHGTGDRDRFDRRTHIRIEARRVAGGVEGAEPVARRLPNADFGEASSDVDRLTA